MDGNKKGYVYIFSDSYNEGVFKIGVTKGTLERRIKKLQTGNPSEIFVCNSYQTEIPFFIEKQLHFRFAHKREVGEWFRLTDEEVLSFKDICKEIEDICNTMKDNYFFKKLKLK